MVYMNVAQYIGSKRRHFNLIWCTKFYIKFSQCRLNNFCKIAKDLVNRHFLNKKLEIYFLRYCGCTHFMCLSKTQVGAIAEYPSIFKAAAEILVGYAVEVYKNEAMIKWRNCNIQWLSLKNENVNNDLI